MTRARTLWMKVPPAIRAGITTALFTFLFAVGAALVGLLEAVRDWAETGSPIDYAVSTKALIAAVTALGAGVLNAVFRYFKPPALAYPDSELLERQHEAAVDNIGRAAGRGDL